MTMTWYAALLALVPGLAFLAVLHYCDDDR